MARYQCWLCPGRPWTRVPVPAGASPAAQERAATLALSHHVASEHGGGR